MTTAAPPLIVGAGPTGCGAALFLARSGIATRVIDIAPEPSRQSKALAVNPRTLELLEPTGVTKQMLAIGLRITGAHLHSGGRVIANVQFDQLHHKYPFMLALSQATTEKLLRDALHAAGGTIERGVGLEHCQNHSASVRVDLKHADSGAIETAEYLWLLAADGARSTVRSEMKIEFPGNSLESPWYLADVPLTTSLEENLVHIFFFNGGGFLFMIRVVDDSPATFGDAPLWRLISSEPNPMQQLLNAVPVGPPVWESSFHISHRINERLQVGNIFFAGDAAHIHSPMGARGMNLGLEDAWVFSELIHRGQADRYAALRRPVDAGVVRLVEFFTRVVLGDSVAIRLLRTVLLRAGTRLPFVRSRLLQIVAGLDHVLSIS